MSGNDRPELRAFRELETLVHSLGEELAAFRRRAIAAEAEVRQAEAGDGGGHGHAGKAKGGATAAGGSGRVAELETENGALRTRLDRAEERVRQMMDRVRFLRQQLQSQAAGVGTGRS